MSQRARLSAAPTALDPNSVECLISLPQIEDGNAVAFACRLTARTFFEHGGSFRKPELAGWLMGPYAALTRLASEEGPAVAVVPTPSPSVLADVDDATVRKIIANARLRLAETIAGIRYARHGASFALRMFAKGYVTAFEDRHHKIGWLPTNHARTLGDRVLSLVAADYLGRPEDYRPKKSDSGEWAKFGKASKRDVEDDVALDLPLPRARLSFVHTLDETGSRR